MMNTREIAKEYRLAHWAQKMQERTALGMNIKEFCEHIGICQNTYHYWQRRVRVAACEQLNNLAPAQEALVQPSFTEIKVVEPPALPTLPKPAQPSQIRIKAAGVQITADDAYPSDKLASLLRELVRSC